MAGTGPVNKQTNKQHYGGVHYTYGNNNPPAMSGGILGFEPTGAVRGAGAGGRAAQAAGPVRARRTIHYSNKSLRRRKKPKRSGLREGRYGGGRGPVPYQTKPNLQNQTTMYSEAYLRDEI